jgi:PatG C-terminal
MSVIVNYNAISHVKLFLSSLPAATPGPADLDCVIGVRSPIASPEFCNGLMVPIVIFDQIYSFDRESLIKAIPKPEKTPAQEFAPAAEELFDRIMQMTDNAGATDRDRALNYLAVRYQAIYANAGRGFRAQRFVEQCGGPPSALSRRGGHRQTRQCVEGTPRRGHDTAES